MFDFQPQIDLFHREFPDFAKRVIFMDRAKMNPSQIAQSPGGEGRWNRAYIGPRQIFVKLDASDMDLVKDMHIKNGSLSPLLAPDLESYQTLYKSFVFDHEMGHLIGRYRQLLGNKEREAVYDSRDEHFADAYGALKTIQRHGMQGVRFAKLLSDVRQITKGFILEPYEQVTHDTSFMLDALAHDVFKSGVASVQALPVEDIAIKAGDYAQRFGYDEEQMCQSITTLTAMLRDRPFEHNRFSSRFEEAVRRCIRARDQEEGGGPWGSVANIFRVVANLQSYVSTDHAISGYSDTLERYSKLLRSEDRVRMLHEMDMSLYAFFDHKTQKEGKAFIDQLSQPDLRAAFARQVPAFFSQYIDDAQQAALNKIRGSQPAV